MKPKLSFPRERIHIILFEGIAASAVELFAEAGYTRVTRVGRALGGTELTDAIASAHMIGIRSRTNLTAEVLDHADKLIAIGCFCIGTNQVDLAAAARRGVPVFNAPHSSTRSVAELVIAEMVMLMRGIGDKSMAAHRGEWRKSAARSHELRGKTVGIIGYGHIGSQVSILAEAFGMRVLFQDIEPKLPMGNATQIGSLDELLPQCDFVTLHVPAAPDTVNLMSAERIGQMRAGAYLLNLSRGNVVDIDALARAIQEEHLLGAAIDVLPKEPKSKDEPVTSPLQNLPNVVLTPHIGGSTQEAQENIGREVASKLVTYSDTGSTLSAVNFPNISLTPTHGAHRLLHIHQNQPGVLGSINSITAELEGNIVGQHLQTTPELGYVVTDVARAHSDELLARLKAVPHTIRARILY